jgi:hypothetical protein
VSVKGTLVEDKMRRFKGECAHFSFNKCPIYTYDGASAKFSTKSHETDNSVSATPPPPSAHLLAYIESYTERRNSKREGREVAINAV